jgi:hypothetical protein
MTHNVAHIKSIERPTATLESKKTEEATAEEESEPWPESFDTTLSKYMPQCTIDEVKKLFLAGPNPPPPKPEVVVGGGESSQPVAPADALPTAFSSTRTGNNKARGKGRDKRGKAPKVEDKRRVVSEVGDHSTSLLPLLKGHPSPCPEKVAVLSIRLCGTSSKANWKPSQMSPTPQRKGALVS